MFRNFLKFTGIVGANVGIFACGVNEGKRHHQIFKKLPREQQRELYNACPEQKFGNAIDVHSIFAARAYMDNPASHQHIAPRVPFDEAYPETKMTRK